MSSKRNIRLLIEYNGAAYCGWQRQADQPTVQEEIERALEKTIGTTPVVIVAGRTDAGVHAAGQVVNFKTDSTINDWQFLL